jgi:hypothetical protein
LTNVFVKLGREKFREQIHTEKYETLRDEWLLTPSGTDWLRWGYPPEKVPTFWKDGRPHVRGDKAR